MREVSSPICQCKGWFPHSLLRASQISKVPFPFGSWTKNRGEKTKMDGLFHGSKPYKKLMIWGGLPPLFLETPIFKWFRLFADLRTSGPLAAFDLQMLPLEMQQVFFRVDGWGRVGFCCCSGKMKLRHGKYHGNTFCCSYFAFKHINHPVFVALLLDIAVMWMLSCEICFKPQGLKHSLITVS